MTRRLLGLGILASTAFLGIGPMTASAAPASKTVALVKVAHNNGLGYNILVNGKGFTLYYWQQEKAGSIKCTADCATAWPPLLVPKGKSVPKKIKGASGTFGIITRPDGKRQVTYNRHALYAYFDDRNPGDTLCQNVNGWFVIKVSSH